MIYAVFGMPLFLMWASQTGTFLAQTFQFLYANICCGLCIRGKKRRAAKEAAKNHRKLQQLQSHPESKEALEMGESMGDSIDKDSYYGGTPSVKPNAKLSNNYMQLLQQQPSDSGVESQQSFDAKSVRIEILEPEVKALLESCAKYNLDHVPGAEENDPGSAEVLEEIRHAEAIETLRKSKVAAAATSSLPNSPFKQANGVKHSILTNNDHRDSNASLYDNSGDCSPTSPLPFPHVAPKRSTATPPAQRRARLGHNASQPSMVVSVNADGSGSPVTTLLKSQQYPGSREVSPSQRGDSVDPGTLSKSKKTPPSNLEIVVTSDRVPCLPVLAFVGGYIVFGATIFSQWEKWTFLEGAYFCFITLTTIGN